MNIVTFVFKEKPRCRTCGLEMKSWDPYADTHEHIECITKRFGENMKIIFDKMFENKNK
jgi:hypothetical protein